MATMNDGALQKAKLKAQGILAPAPVPTTAFESMVDKTVNSDLNKSALQDSAQGDAAWNAQSKNVLGSVLSTARAGTEKASAALKATGAAIGSVGDVTGERISNAVSNAGNYLKDATEGWNAGQPAVVPVKAPTQGVLSSAPVVQPEQLPTVDASTNNQPLNIKSDYLRNNAAVLASEKRAAILANMPDPNVKQTDFNTTNTRTAPIAGTNLPATMKAPAANFSSNVPNGNVYAQDPNADLNRQKSELIDQMSRNQGSIAGQFANKQIARQLGALDGMSNLNINQQNANTNKFNADTSRQNSDTQSITGLGNLEVAQNRFGLDQTIFNDGAPQKAAVLQGSILDNKQKQYTLDNPANNKDKVGAVHFVEEVNPTTGMKTGVIKGYSTINGQPIAQGAQTQAQPRKDGSIVWKDGIKHVVKNGVPVPEK